MSSNDASWSTAPPRITKAENDVLFDESGRRYIDLFSANGTAWLGHSNRAIVQRVAAQLDRVWTTGALDTPARVEASAAVESLFPPSHMLAGFCSTGMEAAEFALRIARVVTKRTGVIGFENSMHGKSLATAYLGWNNRDGVQVPGFHRLPFVQSCSEAGILARLNELLTIEPISAVFVEPLQASGGGYTATRDFYGEVFRLCAEHDVFLVFDEILTGLYRTGTAFFFSELGFVPDIVLIGKGLGNGFPVSAVVVQKTCPIVKAMLPGSTFAGNALASAAVTATLSQIQSLDMPGRVAAIETTITKCLRPLNEIGMTPRGRGAVWIVELPPDADVEATIANIYQRGVSVGYAGRRIRILPAATIDLNNLATGCRVLVEEIQRKQAHTR
jgi:acetylornithine/succinyldiaminopimelate/putrescine aminotransferase